MRKDAGGAFAYDLPQFVLGRMGPIERTSIWVWQAKNVAGEATSFGSSRSNVNQEIHLKKMAFYTGARDKGTTSIIGRCGINRNDARVEKSEIR